MSQAERLVLSDFCPPAAGYAGDISPSQAWQILSEFPEAQLVDVRTSAEWMFVGQPDLSSLGKEPIFLSWRLFPHFMVNPEFSASFLALDLAKDAPIVFLCRSGGRSRDAAQAMTALGYSYCYNIEEGFEGEPDAAGHRGTTSGWKYNGLPWGQK